MKIIKYITNKIKNKSKTDLKILKTIYNIYYDEYKLKGYKNYIPIDINFVAKKLNINADLLFGQLYYHLDYKYRYKTKNNSYVHLFAIKVRKEKHCINFPYMTSIISILKNENKTIKISIISMFISLCSFIVSIMK